MTRRCAGLRVVRHATARTKAVALQKLRFMFFLLMLTWTRRGENSSPPPIIGQFAAVTRASQMLCHPERSEGSGSSMGRQMLRFAQHDIKLRSFQHDIKSH